MSTARALPVGDPSPLPPLPGWIGSQSLQDLETMAFRSGAALAHLAFVAADADLPLALWRDRLALAAAEVCAGLAGRREGQGALRDALHLTKAGDDPGPAGRILRQWSRAVARPISAAGLARALEGIAPGRIGPEQIALCLDTAGAGPVDRAARAIEAVLAGNPRAATAALILGDAVLSKATGRDHVLPLLSLALKPRDMARSGDALRLACHRAVAGGARQAVPLAARGGGGQRGPGDAFGAGARMEKAPYRGRVRAGDPRRAGGGNLLRGLCGAVSRAARASGYGIPHGVGRQGGVRAAGDAPADAG